MNLGLTRVRPLFGGLDAWRELGFPLDDLVVDAASGVDRAA
jgi:hypothetical protein